MLNGSLFSLAQIILLLTKDWAFIRISMDKFKSVDTNVGSGKEATRKHKKKSRNTSGRKIPSLFTPSASSSLTSGDETDSYQTSESDSGSRSKHTSPTKTKNVDVQTEYDSEYTNKFVIRKQKYKVPIEKRSIFPPATSSSHSSDDQSDSEWVCETKDDVASNSLESTNKNVIARAKEKSDKHSSETKHSTSKGKHKSTRGRKKQFSSDPGRSLASADASGSGWTGKANICQPGGFSRTTQNSKKREVDTKPLPEVLRKKQSCRWCPATHKYKSILKKRRASGRNRAPVNPSGSDSNVNYSNLNISPFIDTTYWKMTKICCGIIFKGLNGEVMVDAKHYKPCKGACMRKIPVNETTQSSQSSSNANAGDTDLNSAPNPSTTASMGPEMDA